MEYKCQTVSLEKLPIDVRGTMKPLCDNCSTVDCSHKIQMTTISIFGVTYKHRVMIRGDEPYFVIQCEGFNNEEEQV